MNPLSMLTIWPIAHHSNEIMKCLLQMPFQVNSSRCIILILRCTAVSIRIIAAALHLCGIHMHLKVTEKKVEKLF